MNSAALATPWLSTSSRVPARAAAAAVPGVAALESSVTMTGSATNQ